MVKFLVTTFFFVLLCSCSINNKTKITNSSLQTDNTSNIPNNIKLPNSKDFPYVKPIPAKDINMLIAQIKVNTLLINNLTPNQVLNILGTPLIIKKDNNIEIWQYRNQCILNLIWKKHKSPTAYYLPTPESNKSSSIHDLNYSIIWINSLTNDKKSISTEKCFLQLTNNNFTGA